MELQIKEFTTPDPVQELPPEATIQPQPAFYTADATPTVMDAADALFS